ncbi:MAG: hypothetical protein LW860_00005, partial [Xanthomonadaceae bacterium]|nr:hypothetical protein [Xanthomonadaceae bacterium]
HVTCPSCGTDFPLEAGLLDADAKRLAALFAGLEPVLGRAAIAYLRLFAPPKNRLRLSKAVRLMEQLVDLVGEGTVSADDRVNIRRPANQAQWAAGIEHMLNDPKLVAGCRASPLANHNYLRKVVFGLADSADAVAERAREQSLRQRTATTGGAPQPVNRLVQLSNAINDVEAQLRLGMITADEAEQRKAAARKEHAG